VEGKLRINCSLQEGEREKTFLQLLSRRPIKRSPPHFLHDSGGNTKASNTYFQRLRTELAYQNKGWVAEEKTNRKTFK
jgi:hypothetical protein